MGVGGKAIGGSTLAPSSPVDYQRESIEANKAEIYRRRCQGGGWGRPIKRSFSVLMLTFLRQPESTPRSKKKNELEKQGSPVHLLIFSYLLCELGPAGPFP